MTGPTWTCDDCGETCWSPLELMLCCSPLNNEDELDN